MWLGSFCVGHRGGTFFLINKVLNPGIREMLEGNHQAYSPETAETWKIPPPPAFGKRNLPIHLSFFCWQASSRSVFTCVFTGHGRLAWLGYRVNVHPPTYRFLRTFRLQGRPCKSQPLCRKKFVHRPSFYRCFQPFVIILEVFFGEKRTIKRAY